MIITNLLTENEATTIYSDEEVETKTVLESCLRNRTMEYLQDFLFLHPPINDQSRLQYVQIFQEEFTSRSNSSSPSKSLWQFVHALLEKYDRRHEMKNIYVETVLRYVKNILQKDLEFWCKHHKRKETNNNLPLVKYLFDVNKTGSSYNEENVEIILSLLLKEIKVIIVILFNALPPFVTLKKEGYFIIQNHSIYIQ